MSRKTTTYTVNGVNDLRDVSKEIKERFSVEKRVNTRDNENAVLCKIEDGDDIEWVSDYRRTPLVMKKDEEVLGASAVSPRKKYYTPIPFHTPLNSFVEEVEQDNRVEDISGEITIKKAEKMFSVFQLEGVTGRDATGAELQLDFRLRTAHTGFNAVKAELGMERLVCSNGMTSWIPEETWSHGHNEGQFNPSIIREALEAIITSPEKVQERTEKAHEKQFESVEEALLALRFVGDDFRSLYDLFDDPYEKFRKALRKEAEKTPPSLYDTYNAATRAISHNNELSDFERQSALRTASSLVLDDYGGIHDPNTIGEMAVHSAQSRTIELSDQNDEELFEGEQEVLSELVSAV